MRDWMRSVARRVKAPSASNIGSSAGSRKDRKWRTGCEGRISLLKRSHGLDRSRYKNEAGMERWWTPHHRR
jgi:IS5 family transposase